MGGCVTKPIVLKEEGEAVPLPQTLHPRKSLGNFLIEMEAEESAAAAAAGEEKSGEVRESESAADGPVPELAADDRKSGEAAAEDTSVQEKL